MRAIPPRLAGLVTRAFRYVHWFPGIRRVVSIIAIESLARATKPRPRPYSLVADYTSWESLTNRRYTGRHLPKPSTSRAPTQPDPKLVLELFRRAGDGERDPDTSVLFAFFAQWFTDSFLRTDWFDRHQNTSNHEIDLCQIYGLDPQKTKILRAKAGGRLLSQHINDEEYPAYLFERASPGATLTVKPEFKDLHDPQVLDIVFADVPDERKEKVFAVGLEHGNGVIGNSLLNILFLREHNRIAGLLQSDNPAWDDDRLFETARNILIVILLKLVIEEYIVHIGPFDFPLEAVPFIADGKSWNKSNWIAIEFNALYRWHPLVPNKVEADGRTLGPEQFRNNNNLILAEGIGPLIDFLSRAPAGKIGLFNTPSFIVDRSNPARDSIEERTISLTRLAELASYNDYREAFGLRRKKSFEDLTSNPQALAQLKSLYGSIDKLEWYVGIFAEDYPDFLMMGELMTVMVGYDAFTQALTNPLLSGNVFNEATFTAAGLKLIDSTSSLSDILKRTSGDGFRASFSPK